MGIIRIIEKIADKGMSQILHMNPDLMGSSCFQVERKKRTSICTAQKAIMSDSTFAMLPVYHAFYGRTRFTP